MCVLYSYKQKATLEKNASPFFLSFFLSFFDMALSVTGWCFFGGKFWLLLLLFVCSFAAVVRGFFGSLPSQLNEEYQCLIWIYSTAGRLDSITSGSQIKLLAWELFSFFFLKGGPKVNFLIPREIPIKDLERERKSYGKQNRGKAR